MSAEALLRAAWQEWAETERRAGRAAGRAEVLADVLAYLARRRENAALVATRLPALEPFAEDRRRQLEVMIDELGAGLHGGAAQAAADLAELGPPRAATGHYPFRDHRNFAEVWDGDRVDQSGYAEESGGFAEAPRGQGDS